VKERFMEHHMAERIAAVLKEVLQRSQSHSWAYPAAVSSGIVDISC
jgi:hypothetical protein